MARCACFCGERMKIFKHLKLFLLTSLLLAVAGCSSKKERVLREVERCEEKLNTYRQTVGSLNEDLAKLQQQFELAEDNIIINLVKELRVYHTKKERVQRIEHAVAAKENVEQDIEKTILRINTLTDSVQSTEKRILETKATLRD